MRIELETTANKVREAIAGKVGDIRRGHTGTEETSVVRILSGNISPEDIKRYKEKRIEDAARQLLSLSILYPQGSILTSSSIPDSVLVEIERQKALTPEQLRGEVARDARQKAKEWKLKLTV